VEKVEDETPAFVPAPAPPRPAEWPGFRGPARDGVIHGVRIAADWTASPPVELWRRPIGPGWSSFAVDGDLLYTQEQRGEEELVAAYNVKTGEPVWQHRDPVRFYESNGGAGPRGTPTLAGGRVYALGATGILNALDAATGAVIWSRNASADTAVPVPGWGISSSPVVVNGSVVTAVSGALVAYDAATGAERWMMKSRGGSYSSPQLITIAGVPQLLFQSGFGAVSVAPDTGMVLWEHAWEGFRIVQPAVIPDGSGVILTDANAGGGNSVRRLAVARAADGWTVEERWTSIGLKPYFNDFVIHKGHAFGFDGSILSSINLADGARNWKNGRYGHGQLVLLADQDLLLVVTEEGELALVGATPTGFVEHARFKAIEGKTWNHPVVVNNVLVVRNGEEMAAFRLSPAQGE
jgi:outer membrane protein assembly factor BamB